MPQVRLFTVLVVLCLLPFSNAQAAPAQAAKGDATQAPATPSWPQVLSNGDTRLTIAQPQLDSRDGYTLLARAAGCPFLRQ